MNSLDVSPLKNIFARHLVAVLCSFLFSCGSDSPVDPDSPVNPECNVGECGAGSCEASGCVCFVNASFDASSGACGCDDGFVLGSAGTTCEVDPDCTNTGCLAGVCVSKACECFENAALNPQSLRCECDAGFWLNRAGLSCVVCEIDRCGVGQCESDGCVCVPNASVVPETGICACDSGFIVNRAGTDCVRCEVDSCGAGVCESNGCSCFPDASFDPDLNVCRCDEGFGLNGAGVACEPGATARCGDSITQRFRGETCDNGDNAPGSGCDNCQVESQTLDLAQTSTVGGVLARRTFRSARGTTGNSLAGVAAGDVTADGIPELIVGQRAGGTFRGSVLVYLARPSFFDVRTSTTDALSAATSSATVQFLGVDDRDELGGGGTPGLVTGDVTGDGFQDLILSASGADGPGNSRSNAGEIYVIAGSSDLVGAGLVDLRTAGGSSRVAVRIDGAVANAAIWAMDSGDLNGDGSDDILVGAPGENKVYVVRGGAELLSAGSLDLSEAGNPLILAVFEGAAPGDGLGAGGGKIAQVAGSAALDVIIAAPSRITPENPIAPFLGGVRAGVVWAYIGPGITGTQNVANPGPSVIRWYGPDAFGGLGQSIAVAQVVGDAVPEVLLGGLQLLNRNVPSDELVPAVPPVGFLVPSWQRGGIHLWQGPIQRPVSGVFDGPNGDLPTARVYGSYVGDRLGAFVTTGDVNGDSREDIVALAGNANGPNGLRPNAGEVTVILGGTELDPEYDLATFSGALRLLGPLEFGEAGASQTSAVVADLDRDGKGDVCVALRRGNEGTRVECVRSPW